MKDLMHEGLKELFDSVDISGLALKEKEKRKEIDRIKRLIRRGKLPTRHFAKDAQGRLERTAKGRLTWRTIFTLKELTT